MAEQSSNGQLNLRFDPDFTQQLQRDAERFGFRGKNVVAQDIIQTFYPNWLALQKRVKAVKSEELKKAA